MTQNSTEKNTPISQITVADNASNNHRLFYVGDQSLIKRCKISLLCSVQCPGDIILKTFGLMQDLRNTYACIISGFHSPMEQECLKILLQGTCGIVLCYARGLPKRIPPEYLKPIDNGRMLLVSSFNATQDHATRDTSKQRNQLVIALGDIAIIPYAAPGGMTEAIIQDASNSGKPVFTFQNEQNTNKIIFLTGIAPILQNLSPNTSATPAKCEETTQQTNSKSPKYSLTKIRYSYPRAYEKWTDEEEVRLLNLRSEGKTKREIAQILQRQTSAISSRLKKIEWRITGRT